MMQTPLLLTSFLNRAETMFPNKTIVSRTSPTNIQRFTYAEYGVRVRKLTNALTALGMKKTTKVGTFAWNHHRHLEAYFAIPCTGAILHMINIRLSKDHLTYVINHAEDDILLIDVDLLPLIEQIAQYLTSVKHFIIMSDNPVLPETTLDNVHHYEDLLKDASADYTYPMDLDENAPIAMCYTSATTGLPKGVTYSHRGLVLHSYVLGMRDSMGISEKDIAMPIVPMFHVNAWGMPFAAMLYGATIVLPGPRFTSAQLLDFIETEKVTLTAGVPTIWFGVLEEQEKNPRDISSITRLISGGSASPKGMIRTFLEKYKVPFYVGYGATETSPLVSISCLTTEMSHLSLEEEIKIRATQGLILPGVEVKLMNDDGIAPWDGKTMGELYIRGPWIADQYYKDPARSEEAFQDGWYHSGDIATISPEGYISVTDRISDLIKSGGEWISSIELENALMSHPAVSEAAVIAIPHEKWLERPIAYIVLKKGQTADESKKRELLDSLKDLFVDWWIPDEIHFIDEIPKTTVGKFLKRALRDRAMTER